MPHTVLRVALAGALCTAAAAPRQTVPVTTLGKPLVEFPEGYAGLNGLRELPDGRILTIEVCEQVVKLLDLTTGVQAQVGRSGAGPGEYRTPARLFSLPGDSSLIDDIGNRRFLVIGPDGKPGRFFDPLPVTRPASGSAVVALATRPAQTDARGRFYARETSLREVGANLVRVDSSPLERWDHRGGKRDTLGFIKTANRTGTVVPGQQEVPFTTGTQWAVAPDGRVALVHPGDYRVELIGPAGLRTAGKPIPFERVRVTEGHKQQWREEQKPPCGNRPGSLTGPDGRTIAFVRRPTPEPAEWPELLPPFLANSAIFAPDGMLWVRRTAAADAPTAYDLIDGKGGVVHRIVLPRRTRLLGFGRGSVYLVRMDDDDLQYLQRYPIPRP